jgi:hypothetical protein
MDIKINIVSDALLDGSAAEVRTIVITDCVKIRFDNG